MSVLGYLTGRSSAAVLSTTENGSIATSVGTLQTRLANWFGTDLTTHFIFGSYMRETILPRSMDGLSDVDYMIVFREGGYQPQTYLNRLKAFVEFYYSRSEIYQSSPTIVLDLNHIRFELVPSLAHWSGAYQIPDGAGGWQQTNPNDSNSTLVQKNKDCGYQLKPVIRLAKLWNAQNGYVFGSFQLEKWIAERSYWGCANQRDYLFSIFDGLAVPTDTQWRRNAVDRAKQQIANVRQYEAAGLATAAELEVKKLIKP